MFVYNASLIFSPDLLLCFQFLWWCLLSPPPPPLPSPPSKSRPLKDFPLFNIYCIEGILPPQSNSLQVFLFCLLSLGDGALTRFPTSVLSLFQSSPRVPSIRLTSLGCCSDGLVPLPPRRQWFLPCCQCKRKPLSAKVWLHLSTVSIFSTPPILWQ